MGAGAATDLACDDPRVTAELLGTVVATGCANLGVTVRLGAEQASRAATLLPPRLRLRRVPTLLVETSTAEAVSIDGVSAGPARLSEAALSVAAPQRVTARGFAERAAEDIYMLSQLDSNAALSAFKQAAGYRAELATITLGRATRTGLIGTRAFASADGTLAPATASALLTRSLLPARVAVPNPGIVFKLWTALPDGRLAVTTNVNHGISAPAAGWGRVRVEPGTLLHWLLGSDEAAGIAFAGRAKRFVNDTYAVGNG